MARKLLLSFFAAFLFAYAITTVVADDGDGEGNAVRVLTDDNFEHLTQASTGSTTGDWFIKFYTNWCGHCQRLKPAWEAIAHKYQGKLNVAEVDCQHAGQNVCNRFSIRSYPSIKFMRLGKVYEYSGKDRSEAELARFLDGAWEKAESGPVPPPYSALNVYKKGFIELYDKVGKSFQVIAQQHPEFLVVSSVICFLFGMVVLGILLCVCNSTPALDEKPRKTIYLPRHALRTSDTEEEEDEDVADKPAGEKKVD